MFKNLLNAIRHSLERKKKYFADCKDEIKFTNIDIMAKVSLIAFAIFVVSAVSADLVISTWKISWHYWIVIPVLAFFSITSWILRKKNIPYWLSVVLANLFCFAMFALLINISVFPFPNDPQVFVSLFIMVVPILFVLPFYNVFLIIALGSGVFIALTSAVQPQNVVGHNIFCVIAGMIFSLVLSVLTHRLRLKDYTLRDNYKYLSMRDGLTDCLNRRAFEEAYNALSAQNGCAALMIIDLDGFKQINDQMGHQRGDEILVEFADKVRQTIGTNNLLGRVGGDEFCVLIRRGEQEPSFVAAKIIDNVNKVVVNDSFVLRCSIGVCLDCKGKTYDQALRIADSALYQAKSNGKNTFCVSGMQEA